MGVCQDLWCLIQIQKEAERKLGAYKQSGRKNLFPDASLPGYPNEGVGWIHF